MMLYLRPFFLYILKANNNKKNFAHFLVIFTSPFWQKKPSPTLIVKVLLVIYIKQDNDIYIRIAVQAGLIGLNFILDTHWWPGDVTD